MSSVPFHRLVIVVVAGTLAACSAHEAASVRRAASPLIGKWTRQGNVPSPAGKGTPEFAALTFAADGKLKATYAAGGVGSLVGAAPSVKSENDTYTTSGDAHLSIAEGSRHLEYSYRVDGNTLYLTPSGSSEADQFTKNG